ncbi:MAG: DedA family protein [Chloroflexi bacterium SZAS-1]|jgi:membrane-associated protein|nr:DedA family protein [Chloroflexi bacterium SZAS-1]HNP85229.1 DedA family protein [Kouleothrix sp.]
MGQLIDFVLHIDKYLGDFIQQYGTLTYIILFVVIFCETGLVITPFLPGDSLIFAAGALAAIDTSGTLNVFFLFAILAVAAVLGDTVNYFIGAKFGTKLFDYNIPLLKKEHLDRTYEFYEKYGGKTIILARFVPIVRTFAPFVAGVGRMNYSRFITFNVIGGVVWVAIFTFLGYVFGNVPFVKQNFEIVTLAIVLISVLPMVIEYVRSRRRAKAPAV